MGATIGLHRELQLGKTLLVSVEDWAEQRWAAGAQRETCLGGGVNRTWQPFGV
jgi:hypothetical protein